MGERTAGTIPLVCNADGRLQYRTRLSVDIELAAGEPAEVSRIGGIEQQERSLAIGCQKIQTQSALIVFDLEFKTGLLGDVRDKVGVELE